MGRPVEWRPGFGRLPTHASREDIGFELAHTIGEVNAGRARGCAGSLGSRCLAAGEVLEHRRSSSVERGDEGTTVEIVAMVSQLERREKKEGTKWAGHVGREKKKKGEIFFFSLVLN